MAQGRLLHSQVEVPEYFVNIREFPRRERQAMAACEQVVHQRSHTRQMTAPCPELPSEKHVRHTRPRHTASRSAAIRS